MAGQLVKPKLKKQHEEKQITVSPGLKDIMWRGKSHIFGGGGKGTLYCWWGMQIGTASVNNNMEFPLKNLKLELTYDPCSPTRACLRRTL